MNSNKAYQRKYMEGGSNVDKKRYKVIKKPYEQFSRMNIHNQLLLLWYILTIYHYIHNYLDAIIKRLSDFFSNFSSVCSIKSSGSEDSFRELKHDCLNHSL